MPRRRIDSVALPPMRLAFRNTLRSFIRDPGLASHVGYPIDFTRIMTRELICFYRPMIIIWLFLFLYLVRILQHWRIAEHIGYELVTQLKFLLPAFPR